MAAQRRTSREGSRGAAAPRARSGPGRPGAGSGRTTLRNGLGAAAAAAQAAADRPRFTGRAVILLLVLAVLGVSWASSFRAWMQQRDDINGLRTQMAEDNADVDELRGEIRRHQDPEFIQQIAHQRFGYVMPGEQAFIALDEDGEPIGAVEQLPEQRATPAEDEPTWYDIAWGSVEAAGNPEEDDE